MGPTRAVVRLPRRGSPCPAPGARPCRGAAPRVPHCRPARAGTRDEWHEEAAGRRGSTRLSPEDSAWETPGTSSFEAGPPAPRTLSPDRLEVIRAEDEAMEDADRARRVAARVPGAVGRPTAGLSSEHKARISAALKGRSVNGSTLSAEHKVWSCSLLLVVELCSPIWPPLAVHPTPGAQRLTSRRACAG